MDERQDIALIPRFGKTVSREEYKLFKSLALAKKECLVNELTGLLMESIKFDAYISAAIVEKLEGMGFVPNGITAQLKFIQKIEQAKRGDKYSRLWVDLWDKASFHLSKGEYEHPAIRKYRYFAATENKKPRQPIYEIELRNRQIAQIIYNARKVTSFIPFQPYTDPAQIDAIERQDDQKRGLSHFLKNFDLWQYPPFDTQPLPKRRRNDPDPGALDATQYRRIYTQHRRALIISDLVSFAEFRALL